MAEKWVEHKQNDCMYKREQRIGITFTLQPHKGMNGDMNLNWRTLILADYRKFAAWGKVPLTPPPLTASLRANDRKFFETQLYSEEVFRILRKLKKI